MDKAGVAFLVLICILVALVVSILGFVPEEVPPDVPEVTPPTPPRGTSFQGHMDHSTLAVTPAGDG